MWRALHVPSGRPVAVKWLLDEGPGRLALAREVHALASLSHPAIATIHDAGVTAGRAWLALELGTDTLAERRPRSLWGTRDVLLELLGGLAHAHARGVIHRDIKPSNALWVADRIKLADFGIAVLREESGPVEASGTPLYLAPEQLSDERTLLGPQTDLYALGWLAWELFAGSHPWEDRPPAWLIPAQGLAPLPPWPDELPDALGTWVKTCLNKAPSDRFERAADAAHALAALDLGERAVDPPRPAASATFSFASLPPTPPLELAGTAAPMPGPFPASWRPDRRWTPAPLPLAGLGLYAQRRIALVGREDLQDALWSELTAAAAGDTRIAVLRGAPGVGCSALARWLCERAHELGAATDLRVPAAPDLPGALVATLGPSVRRLGVPASCTPETREILGGASSTPVRAEAYRAALGDWLEAVTRRRPAILWVDDAPTAWVEAARALAERGAGRTLILLVTRLPVPGGRTLEVAELGPHPRRALVGQLLGLEDLEAARLVERTGGVPGFTVDLVGDWVERGWLVPGPRGFRLRPGVEPRLPPDRHAAWQRRLARLELADGERAALEQLAVWEAGGGRGDERVWPTLGATGTRLRERLVASGLLMEDGGGAWFAHPLFRQSALQAASEAGRAAGHHGRCAGLLDPEREPGRVGLHLRRAGRSEEARPLLAQGIRRATSAWSVGRASVLAGEAEQAGSSEELDLARAVLAHRLGDAEGARTLAEPLVDHPDRAVAFQAVQVLAQVVTATQPAEVAQVWAERAVALADESERPSAERTLASILVMRGEVERAEALLAPLRDHADPWVRAAAWHTSGALSRRRGDSAEALLRYERAVDEHTANGDRYRAVLASMARAGQLVASGQQARARDAFRETLRSAEAIGSPDATLARLNLAFLALQVGDAEGADALIEPCRRAFAADPVLGVAVVLAELHLAGLRSDVEAFDERAERLEASAVGDADPSFAEALEQAIAAWAHHPARAARLRAILERTRA